MNNVATGSINITSFIDEAPITRFVVRICLLCAAVALVDGIDTSSIGAVAPLIAKELDLSQAKLGPIFSSATLGMMIGALSFGPLADRFGRKRMLVVATFIFGVFTAATAFATSFSGLLAVRLLVGIGLGGATPCFIALASEYAPKSRRAMVTSLIWAAFPFGVILGAILNAYILAHSRWQTIFLIGGVLPLIVCLAVLVWLPESLRFMLLRRPEAAQTRVVVSRIPPAMAAGSRIVTDEEDKTAGSPVASLFKHGKATETLLIWFAFLAAFGMTAATFYWSPVLMNNHGVSLPVASLIVGVGGGVGALVGAAVAGRLMEKFGATLILATIFLVSTATVAVLGYAASNLVLVSLVVVANGTLITGCGTSGMLALSASLYPVDMRSTGVGWAMGAGRFGEVVLPLLVALVISVSGSFGGGVFLTAALVPFLAAISILLLSRMHVRPQVAELGI